jgi:hypothetical protein
MTRDRKVHGGSNYTTTTDGTKPTGEATEIL